jgi:hypothetical protein
VDGGSGTCRVAFSWHNPYYQTKPDLTFFLQARPHDASALFADGVQMRSWHGGVPGVEATGDFMPRRLDGVFAS